MRLTAFGLWLILSYTQYARVQEHMITHGPVTVALSSSCVVAKNLSGLLPVS